jgi:DNA repair photolyase
MKPSLQEHPSRKIVNVHKHVDGAWFWTRYSAKPYIGCAAGCPFCYLRGGIYLGKRDPATFDTLIQAKTNAPELLRKELAKLDRDIIMCGDWQQPAERVYQLSRRMLEVVFELAFPVFVLERSVLVTRDIDLLSDIARRSWAGVAFSFVGSDEAQRDAFEFRCPSVAARLKAMEAMARAGVTTGTVFMPIIPFIGDTQERLEDMIRATKDHGGSFVLAGGLTMGGVQSELTLQAALRLDPTVGEKIRRLYHWAPGGLPANSPPRTYTADLGRRVRELCARHGIADRMRRYVAPGPLALNKKIAERLFLQTHDLELQEAYSARIWAYRKAAWVVDDWQENLGDIYLARGEAGLAELPEIGASMATRIAGWLREEAARA